MTIIDTLVYDRTQSDVDRRSFLSAKGLSRMTAAERAEYLSGLKGGYNASDMNRVGEALLYLQEELRGYGYSVTVTPKTDWEIGEIPTPQQKEEYLGYVASIRDVLEVFQTTPETPPTMEKLTFQRANDIEKILVDVETVIKQVAAGFWRSDAFTMWSGSNHLPSSKSDLGRTWNELDAMNVHWTGMEDADWYLLAYGTLGT